MTASAIEIEIVLTNYANVYLEDDCNLGVTTLLSPLH